MSSSFIYFKKKKPTGFVQTVSEFCLKLINIGLVRVLLQSLNKKGINKTSVEAGIRDVTLFFKKIIIEI